MAADDSSIAAHHHFHQHVFVMRHGERLDFVDHEFQRRTQLPNHYVPLTDRGLQMATETGVALRGHGIHRVYSSPFVRCMQTAQRVTEALGLDSFLVDEGLSEFMGETWFSQQPVHALTMHQHRAGAAREGKTVPTFSSFAHDVEERVVAECTRARWAAGPPSAPAPYPETLAACLDRYVTAFLTLADRHRGENVLLISHGYACHYIPTLDAGLEPVPPHYCSVSRMRREGGSAAGKRTAHGREWTCEWCNRVLHGQPLT